MEKKQLSIFLSVAYGITFLMGILMWYGYGNHVSLSAFPNAQMLYPMAGVMLAYLITKRNDPLLPKWYFGVCILLTAVMIVLAVLSVLLPKQSVIVSGVSLPLWQVVLQYTIVFGSVLCWIFYLAAGKERRAAYGLSWKNLKGSVFCIVLFIVLYFLRPAISLALTGQFDAFLKIWSTPFTWTFFAIMPVNFLLAHIAFLGEEYGWRYYLQPLLQKRFGLRTGVIVLGIVWGLWHLPIDFFYYYTPAQGIIGVIGQIITCITLGIFFAYAYMKTNNIWVPVILHYLNNNMTLILTGGSNALENQSISWENLPALLIINTLLFGLFLFSKEFRKKE